jgi:tetratricopeptide (TPR) repeat protein
MIQLSTINQWLQQPGSLQDPDAQQQVDGLLKAYPWFAPAHMLDAAAKHTQQPFAPELLAKMQLYAGNWLLLHELLQKATDTADEEVTVIPPVVEPVTANAQQEPAPAAPVHEEPVSKVHDLVDHIEIDPQIEPATNTEPLIQPVFTEDYFLHQGITVPEEIPAAIDNKEEKDEDKSLMVVMSFAEWLTYFKKKNEKEKEEEEDKRALKSMWQKEKLAAAMEEENDEIPETVFEMAVNSIAKEEGLISESLAEIMIKQGKYDKAVDMYRKLSLRNPQKNTYFAHKIEAILKDKKS